VKANPRTLYYCDFKKQYKKAASFGKQKLAAGSHPGEKLLVSRL
jgi:hypothetical protein